MKAAQAAGEEAPGSARSVKVVLVGDGGCGKTSLLMVFADGAFPETYSPTVFERHGVNLQMKGKSVHLQIWDTAGQDDYDRLRPLFYPDASVLLLCFDVTSPNSFENIFNRWYPEVTHFCKGVPIIVVGCKTDLRKDKTLVNKLRKNGLEPVTYHRGQEMARSVGAVAYLECSARLHDNVHAVFQEAVEVAFSSRSRNFWRRITQSFCVLT
ncbi:Rho-related GTP-binding protein RhoD [Heterocephalus glaber]|uniref:Rho-related GTP-binding protein RhoD n=1 Tax=Heterocephalus glaber TaxID=10181 RepID=G5BSB8_HETGA|nr:rho-related GTP-binding protein RhoD [Heterocephalus glaber]EHB12179.1 Rho-related GTP-binding protein RhoD [Heterocephalus glaber]